MPSSLSSSSSHSSHAPSGPGNEPLIPRPPNAFICFRMEVAKNLREPDSLSRLRMAHETKATAEMYEKQPYVDMTNELDTAHKFLYPDYKYAPIHRAAKKDKQAARARSKTRSPRGGPGGSHLRMVPYPNSSINHVHSPPPTQRHHPVWPAQSAAPPNMMPFAAYSPSAPSSTSSSNSAPTCTYEFNEVDPSECQDFEALYQQYLDPSTHAEPESRRG
ncbi:hypothetical protein FB45DRAFT_1026144 [Roridomyces roridus]|uniref:HMG box domain-containing protein n=1 Tax=Roridomyces roridus TaxID=1738132 RepID=A0AAD7C053_9AGAR|nr:hypothetical protein FB45DRAFT_1026144 [Roridomyces roridus]